MAISVKDIQEKVFPTQAVNGYNVEQVDDFLDEIVEQLSSLIRENLTLQQRVAKCEEDLAAKAQAIKEMEAKTPDYNEEGYFKNLQNAMRDTLISAQRVADEATNSAKAEAAQLVEDAKAEAERVLTAAKTEAAQVTESAQSSAEAAKAEYESLKAAADSYRASFRKMLEAQLAALDNTAPSVE